MVNYVPDRRGVLAGSLALATLLSGCATSVKRTTWPDITFQHLRPIGLRVSQVVFDDAASSAIVEPPARDIGYALPTSPALIMERWSRERLHAAGGGGMARVTLLENRFAEVPLGTTGGVEGVFTNDQSERYEGVLAARVAIEGDPGGSGFAEARATASRTVPEGFTLNQREETLYNMISGIVTALDARLEQEIRNNLGKWIQIG